MDAISSKGAHTIFKDVCNRFGINEYFIMDCYNQKHRKYHKFRHIINIINQLNLLPKKINCEKENEKELQRMFDLMCIAALYHDIVYDPTDKDSQNELKSCEVFESHFNNELYISQTEKYLIKMMILNTKNHIYKHDYCFKRNEELCFPLSTNYFHHKCISYFLYCDLWVLAEGSYEDLLEYENGIFYEYQFAPYKTYKEKRVEVLEHYRELLKKVYLVENKNIDKLIEYVKRFEPKIGFYAGSFNPFHVGHLDILTQAENMFDKVIIGRGINHEKENISTNQLPDLLKFHQVIEYNEMMSDAIKEIGHPVYIVRGLRDGDDFKSEKKLHRYTEGLSKINKQEYKFVYFISNMENEHISSKDIRGINSYMSAKDTENDWYKLINNIIV